MGTVIKNTQQDGWDDNDLPVVDPSASVNIDPVNFRDEIAAHESKGMGDYQAINNDSTAKGRYQFMWSQYGDQIRKTTGVKNAQEFLNNPQAQDQFMDKYTQNDVIPWVKKMKDAGETRGLSDKQLGQLYHFVGQPGAEHYLQTGKYIVPGHNTSIGDYTTEKVPVSQSASTWDDNDLPVVDGQKKSPDVSAATSGNSSQGGQSGVSQNNPQQPFVWNGATPNLNVQPVSAQDAVIQTAQAKQAQIDQNAAVMNGNSMTDKNNNAAIAIHTDLADAIDKGQLAPSNNDVAATLNAASDPHGDPAYNGQVMQQRISTLESQKQQALLNKDQAGADNIDVKLAQLRTAYDHIRGLQQANAIYQQQKTQEQAQLVATPQPQEATTDVNSFNPSAPVAVTENTPQQGVDAGSGVTPAVQAGLDYQSQNNLQKLAASQPYDATTIGLEHQALGGNKDAQKDLAKYKTGVPLDPAKKVAYQANGLNILHNAAASAAENNQEDAATQFNSVSDNPDQRLENDNPQFFKDYHANLIANTRYNKDGNPFYSTLFSEPQISQQQLEQYGKENNLTPEQIAKLKPSDIPTGANWFEEAGQGAINAVPFLNTLAPETKKIFIGNTPTDQQSGKGVKGFLSHAMSGVGMVGSFMAQTALTGGLLKGAGILGDVGENAARYDTWATRIPLAMSNFNSSYEHAKEVVGDDPKDEGKRMLYAITNGTLSTALMSIDPYAKVGQEALAETKNGLADLLKNKDLADITKQEYQSAVERQAAKILEGSKVTAQHVGTQAGIMGANQIAQNLADKVFDPEHPHEVMDNVKDAAIGGAMALILPSIGAGYAAAKANTPLNVATMWEMGKNPEQYKSYIDDHLAKGTMTKEDAITSYQNLNKISQAVEATRNIETPSGEPLTPEQKARYAFSLFQEQKLNEKLESLQAGEKTTNLQPDKAQIDPINSQIKEQQAQRGDILTNAGAESEQEKPIPAGTQSDEDNTIKVKELVGRNILYKGEPATVSIDDGGEVTVTNKQTGKTHILGQSVKIGDDSAKNYDIEEPAVKGGPSVVSVNDAGNITVRGKEYKIPDEHTDNPIGAINYYNRPGEKGKPVSVTLLNDDGKQVTFRGDVGEDIMYHLHLKKLDKNNSRNDLMDFANNDAESKQKIHDNVGNSENNNIPLSGDNDNNNQSQQNLTENESIKGQNGRQSSTKTKDGQEGANAESSTNGEKRGEQEEDRVLNPTTSGENKAGAAEKPQPANSVLSKADKIAALKKKHQIKIEQEPALRPIDGGQTEGQPEEKAHDDLAQSAIKHPDKPSDYLFAGKEATGETPDNFTKTLGKGFDEIDKDGEKYPDNSVVVTHSTVINTLKAAKELSPGDPHNFEHPDLWKAYDKQETDPGRLMEYKTPDGRTIWLARHGESEDGEKELERTKDTPLTDGGRDEAKNIANDLKEKGITPSKIITSDLPRAKETADIIQKEFVKPEPKEQPKETPKSNGAIATPANKKPESLTPKKEKNASPQSKEQQQKSPQQGSEPEHARVEPAGSKEAPAKTKNSDSDQRSPEKKEVTPTSSAEQNRKDGSFVKDGITYNRNGKQEGPTGGEGKVEFSKGVDKPFTYQLIESDQLQPASRDGNRNPNHFIPEAQPKQRTDAASKESADRISDNPDLGKVGEAPNAYSGAPVVNARGEIIQGNNRGEGLIKHYEQKGDSYKKQLAENAEKYGLTKEQVEGMNSPILVRRVDVGDQEAIKLGNYDVKDIETGGKNRIEPVATSRRMSREEKNQLVNAVLEGQEDKTLNAGIRDNFDKVIKLLNNHLRPAQIDALTNRSGEPTKEGLEDVQKLITHFMFDDGDVNLPEHFENLSDAARGGLIKALPKILGVAEEDNLLPEIQNAILAHERFKTSNVDNFGEWKRQSDLFSGKAPQEIYTPLELKIAEKFSNAKNQKEVADLFSQYAAKVKDTPADMFSEAKEGLSRADAVKEIFKTTYDEQQSRNERAQKESERIGDEANQVPVREEESGAEPVAQEAPNPAGEGEAKLAEPTPEEVAAAEELTKSQQQHAEYDRQLKDNDLAHKKELALLQNHIAKGKEAEQKLKIALKGGDKDAIGNLTDEVNNRKKLVDKHQDNIDRLEREKSALQRDQEIADNANALADKWQSQFEKNLKNHRGEALIAGLPKLSEKVQSFLVEHAIQAIRDLANVRIAIRRAIRETKERWGKEADALSDEHIKALEDHFPEFNKRPKFEPKLPGDHEALAKDILDLMRSGDISHEEAQQIVHEYEIKNREGEDYSEHVAENNKADILNYIDWHNDNDLTSIKNATTRMRREQYGLDEEMPAEKKTFGDSLEEAKKQIADGLNPRDLVDELAKNPRPVTDVENAIMAIHARKIDNDLSDLNTKVKDAAEQGNKADLVESITARASLLDEAQKLYDVTKAVGTENARGLASRKIMIDRKYSLVNMLAEKRSSANDGKPLSEEQQAHIEELHQKIKDAEDAFEAYQKQKEEEILKLQRQVLSARQEQGGKAPSGGAGKTNAHQSNIEKSYSKSQKVANKMRAWADSFEKKNKGNVYSSFVPITPKMIADAVRLVADGVEKGGNVLEWVQKAVSKATEENPGINESTIEKHINQALIDSGVPSPTPENNSKIKTINHMSGFFKDGKLDEHAVKLNVAANRAKEEFDQELERDRKQQLSRISKIQDTFVKWERAFKLSSPLTIGKLAVAGLTRLATDPLEEAVGGAYSAVMPKLAKGAIGEGGGLNVRQTAKAFTKGFMLGIDDIPKIMKTGKSDFDIFFGKGGELPPEAIDFFGTLHSAVKSPIKRAIFESKFEKRVRNTIANGGDVSDPAVMTAISVGAFKDANRAIFMQDNTVTEAYQNGIRYLERVDPKTGKNVSDTNKAIATFLKFTVPFVKIGSNLTAETARYAYGLPAGVAQSIHAYIGKNIEGLTEDQKDIIFRNLKKGTLGAAALALGYFNPNSFGGYYQQGQKRKDNEPEVGGIRIGGTNIPGWAVEAPVMQAMQIGATVRKLADKWVHGERQGMGVGVVGAAVGLLENNPMVANPIRWASMFNPREREYFEDEIAKSTLIPAGVSYLAKATDPADKGNPIRKALDAQNERKSPKTLKEHLESGIPGLRENLPLKHPKPAEEQTQFQ